VLLFLNDEDPYKKIIESIHPNTLKIWNNALRKEKLIGPNCSRLGMDIFHTPRKQFPTWNPISIKQ